MKKINSYLLILGLVAGILFCLLLYPFFWMMGIDATYHNPEIAYMFKPILTLTYLIITPCIIALALAGVLVFKSRKEEIFCHKTVRGLKAMGHALAFSFAANILMIIYSYAQLGSDVGLMGAYMILLSGVLFLGMNLLYFLASLFQRAVNYKEENDLVV